MKILLTDDPHGPHVHLDVQSRRALMRFDLAGTSLNLSLGRMEFIRFLGGLMEFKDKEFLVDNPRSLVRDPFPDRSRGGRRA